MIGPNIRIQGEVSGDEDLVIDGRVDGKISMGKTLKIGTSAQVNAEIRARTVTIAGRVVGNVTAIDRVEILPTGQLDGNIRAPKIAIADGAQFKGSVDMGGKQPGPVEAPATSAATPAAQPAAPAPPPAADGAKRQG